MNPLYEILNRQYIQQQAQPQNHVNQIAEVQKSVKALKDFLDSTDRIQPEYQKMAKKEYCAMLLNYLKTHNLL